MIKSSTIRHPVPVEMRPQNTGSGIVTRLKAMGLGVPPTNVILPLTVPPFLTVTSV